MSCCGLHQCAETLTEKATGFGTGPRKGKRKSKRDYAKKMVSNRELRREWQAFCSKSRYSHLGST